MNPLYPRTIIIKRPNVTSSTQGGATSFGGDDLTTNSTVIFTGLCANISFKGADYRNPTDLPTDARGSRVLITIPAQYAALGTIKTGDIVIDDTGLNFRVSYPDYQLLGYELQAEFMTP